MKFQQNIIIFDHSIIEDLARESNHMQLNMNFNNDKDSEQNLKKYYAK